MRSDNVRPVKGETACIGGRFAANTNGLPRNVVATSAGALSPASVSGGMGVTPMSGRRAVGAPIKTKRRFAESGKLGGGQFYLCPSCGLINSCFGSCSGLSPKPGLLLRHEKPGVRLFRNLCACLVVLLLLSCMVMLSGCATGDPVFTASAAHRDGWEKFEPSRIPPPWSSP